MTRSRQFGGLSGQLSQAPPDGAGEAPRRLRMVGEEHQRLEYLEFHEQELPVLHHPVHARVDR